MAMATILELKDIRKRYAQGEGELEVLRGISFTLARGEFASIMGPSGSGKSSLLHIIGGLDTPSAGEILFDGKSIAAFNDRERSEFRRRKLGFIFQSFNLLPSLSALENVALPLLLDGRPMREIRPRAEALLKKVELSHRMDHKPGQLSGGEMQRVAIARALVASPLLILADEPTGNLDSKNGQAVLEILKAMVAEEKHTLVMVTHDPNAAAFGSRTIFLKDGLVQSQSGKPSA